jgi:hypothetical protein
MELLDEVFAPFSYVVSDDKFWLTALVVTGGYVLARLTSSRSRP